jgi:hypothetical protein
MSSCSHLDHAPGDTSCADCLRLDDARRRLREADEEPSAAAMQRVWAGYTARRSAPKLPWSWGLGAALAAGLAAVWLLSSSAARTAPELLTGRAPWVAPADTQLSFAGGQLAARAGATLALDHPEVLRLTAGELRWMQPTTPAWLSTPHALVRAEHAALTVVVVAGRTTVRVEVGEVDVSTAETTRRVRAGEAVVIAPAVSAPAVAAEPQGAPIDEPAAEAHAALEPEHDDDTTPPGAPSPRDMRREVTRARAAARAPSPVEVQTEAAPALEAAAPEAPAPPPTAPEATVAPAPVSPAPEAAPAAPPPELAQARAILSSNPEGARALTEALRRQGASPAVEVEALMIESDAARRSGDLSDAVALCERVIAHPSGHSFAEEAMLRAARIHSTLGAPAPALSLLDRARQRYPRGALRPEREALAAALLRSRGELERATALVEALPLERGALALAEERVTLAEAWLPRAPARARALAAPVATLPWPEALRTRAAQVLATQP